ncbi:metal cation symporter ZIP14-like [Paramacrobiotus metropolitanus]|uniref:metal cation symporter ZIP14-like n=1 Tax=Paramacrobiotus metropolitanus TaxID=2943436 RepID=UPI002446291B|nr:metal cation symporter ZIP14-like [Paramacrobiotus metropolitanus]
MGKSHCGHDACTIRITSIAVIGICCCCAQLWSSVNSLATENDIYDDVARSFDGQLIRVTPDFQNVIDRVFERLHYSRNTSDRDHRGCNTSQCLKADDVFRYVGYLPGTEVLTPKTFLTVSLPVIVYTLDIRLFCDRNISASLPCSSFNQTTVKDRMDCWISMLLKNSTSLAESELNRMFSKLSEIYNASANYNRSNGVIHVPSMFRNDLRIRNGRGLTKDKVPLFSAVLLSRLFHGAPIIPQEDATNASGISSQEGVTVYSVEVGRTATTGILEVDADPEAFVQSIFDLDSGSRLSVEKLTDIMQHLKIGNLTKWKLKHTNQNVNRDADESKNMEKRSKRQSGVSAQKSVNGSCWALDELLDIFEITQPALSRSEFLRLCPALVQQTYSGVCERSSDSPPVEKPVSGITDAEKYGYGTASVVIISLLSVLGIIFVPLLRRKVYYYALQGFIALGVGTLCGDALLHLLPEALHIHEEHQSSSDSAKPDLDIPDNNLTIWRGVACLGAIYVFFLWEVSLHYFISHRKRHKKSDAKGQTVDDDEHTHAHHDHSHVPDPSTFAKARNQSNGTSVAQMELKPSKLSNGELKTAEHQHVHADDQEKFLGIAPLAWMILLGDSIHNFGDGLTIAAAFSVDVRSGISTSIAIFCHEIPHELGDFAILLNTGMPFKRALILNFISALTCLIGFYIGIPIASYDSARQWIFTIAAGMFLYVALADMLPELKHGASNILMLVMQNLGLIVGVGIMILMALYEEAIQI